MKKGNKGNILLIIVAILIVMGGLLWATINQKLLSRVQNEPVIRTESSSFGTENVSQINTDTFLSLLHQNFQDRVKLDMKEETLTIEITNLTEAELTKFYNDNSDLVKKNHRRFGFHITPDLENKQLKAEFRIEGGFTFVPNDVLIGLVK